MRSAAQLVLLLLPAAAAADDWERFRGPSGSGVSKEAEAPIDWGPGKNILWRTPIPGAGNSSPIVSKGRVFVTAAENQGRKRSLFCLDRKTGALLWTRSVEAPENESTHEDNPHCSSTPCADGERVVVWHWSAGLHCYDLQGKPLWERDLGKFAHIWGHGSSPVIHDGRVLLNCGPGERTFLVSLDKKTGKVAWKADEPGVKSTEWAGSWSTPVIATVDGKEQAIIAYPDHVNAYDPASGRILWTLGGLSRLVYTDVALGNGIGVATGDRHAGECVGFRIGGQKLWSRPRPYEVGTGLIVDGHLWTVDHTGIVSCTEAESGRELLKGRFPGGAAWSSMVAVGKRCYVTARNGDTVVFVPDPKKFSTLAVNSLGEPSNATPAISDGQIFLRTSKALYAIGK